MSENGDNFVEKLEQSGFFSQVGSLQESLGKLSEDIAAIGERSTQRLEEMESIAAHVMAVEAVLAVMLESHPVDPEAVKAKVADMTRDYGDDPDGSPTVQAVAQDLVARRN